MFARKCLYALIYSPMWRLAPASPIDFEWDLRGSRGSLPHMSKAERVHRRTRAVTAVYSVCLSDTRAWQAVCFIKASSGRWLCVFSVLFHTCVTYTYTLHLCFRLSVLLSCRLCCSLVWALLFFQRWERERWWWGFASLWCHAEITYTLCFLFLLSSASE